MRTLVLFTLICLVPQSIAGEKATARVEGTLVVPKDIGSFKDRVLEIRMYRHDPRIADTKADLVELIELKDFAHGQGTETKKTFVIGAKANPEPKLGYYVTVFVLDGKQRTHIGECDHAKKNLCRVLTDGNPNKISLTLREVKK